MEFPGLLMRHTWVKLFIGSKVQSMFCFEICTPEGWCKKYLEPSTFCSIYSTWLSDDDTCRSDTCFSHCPESRLGSRSGNSRGGTSSCPTTSSAWSSGSRTEVVKVRKKGTNKERKIKRSVNCPNCAPTLRLSRIIHIRRDTCVQSLNLSSKMNNIQGRNIYFCSVIHLLSTSRRTTDIKTYYPETRRSENSPPFVVNTSIFVHPL